MNGTVYTERKEAGEAIIALCKTMTDPDQKIELGEYRGFPMVLYLDDNMFKIKLKQRLSYSCKLADDASGNITRINNTIDKIPEHLQAHTEQLAALQKELANAKKEAARPFDKEAELQEKSARLAELNAELDKGGLGGGNPARDRRSRKSPIRKAIRQLSTSVPEPGREAPKTEVEL